MILSMKDKLKLSLDGRMRTNMHDHADTVKTTTKVLPTSTEAQKEGYPRLAKVTTKRCEVCNQVEIEVKPLESSRRATTVLWDKAKK